MATSADTLSAPTQPGLVLTPALIPCRPIQAERSRRARADRRCQEDATRNPRRHFRPRSRCRRTSTAPNSASASMRSPRCREGNSRGGGPVEPLPSIARSARWTRRAARRRPRPAAPGDRRPRIPAARARSAAPRRSSASSPSGRRCATISKATVVADAHQRDPEELASGKDELLMDNAAIDTERANLWGAMGRLEQMIHLSKAMDAKLEETAADSTTPIPQGEGDPRNRTVLIHTPAHAGSADADGGDGAGLSGARPRQEEQRRTGEGRRSRQHHDRLGAAHPR